jgi:hypothetical protein
MRENVHPSENRYRIAVSIYLSPRESHLTPGITRRGEPGLAGASRMKAMLFAVGCMPLLGIPVESPLQPSNVPLVLISA